VTGKAGYWIPEYTVWNFIVSYVWKEKEIYFKINNLFDERYYSRSYSGKVYAPGTSIYPAGNYTWVNPGAPREFVLGTKWEFFVNKRRTIIFIIVFGAGLVSGALPFPRSFSSRKISGSRSKWISGLPGKPALRRTVEVDRKNHAEEAVSLVFPVMSGKVCSSIHDLLEINGVSFKMRRKTFGGS